jgi:alkylated DNA repair dioxygenase AlkB
VIVLDEDGALVEYLPDFLDAGERRALRQELVAAQAHFDRDVLTMYGRKVQSPRLVCAFGDEGLRYRYSGVERPTRPWTPAMRALRARLDGNLNYALVNWYRDGNDYLGWHADKEKDLERGAPIASVSLGATRRFLLRDRKGKGERTLEVSVEDGSLLWMRGTTQEKWKHSVPRQPSVTDPRWNLTFRQIKGHALPENT